MKKIRLFKQHSGKHTCFVCGALKNCHVITLNLAQLRLLEKKRKESGRFGNLTECPDEFVCKTCVRILRKGGVAPSELDDGWTFVSGDSHDG